MWPSVPASMWHVDGGGARGPTQGTHREMIPGGKLLGMALVSTQKALSLVQEQVAGQRGVFGALLASDGPGRQRDRAARQTSAVHFQRVSVCSILSAGGDGKE